LPIFLWGKDLIGEDTGSGKVFEAVCYDIETEELTKNLKEKRLRASSRFGTSPKNDHEDGM
jgi:hypothetical protein